VRERERERVSVRGEIEEVGEGREERDIQRKERNRGTLWPLSQIITYLPCPLQLSTLYQK
jgi:hypothetical protein